jgi:hypothetical protein
MGPYCALPPGGVVPAGGAVHDEDDPDALAPE